ncbi:hypothetical protein GH5_01695 [Leishmania sp. Ghana 2012 LV757]|uniref:hypothetical protein n=1 Tax=Leishmania sp. Ghana 2012 LV757 TaxID=2803181 RepID=UPI001B447DE4|nr:hypothetical protein GH5_01695 [Leishmania sp. Ghana 2012 LV757]
MLISESSHQESRDECKGLVKEAGLAVAKAVIEKELGKVIEEIAAATGELSEVEDVMMEEADRAVLALRCCDGEITLRVERLMD